jgi:RHS repeat-associated protein
MRAVESPEYVSKDSDGNLVTKVNSAGTTQYFWDFEKRMTSVTLPGTGGTVSFKYDPFGRRIYKSSSSATSVYAYDGDNLVEETNSAGGVVARYEQTQNIDEPLAMLRSSTTSYFHADGLGSVTSLSNAAGSIANTYTYDSFGKLTASTGSLVNPFQYTARESDSKTGLYYYRARYYDQSAGRFLNEDPIRFNTGPNFYSYVRNNPADLIDPSGLSPCLNINAFVNELNNNAGDEPDPEQNCAKYVRWALEAGGINTNGHPVSAKNYGPFLQGQGFSNVSPNNYTPQPGDIAVIQPYPGGNQNGHIEGWNGSQWVSSFNQPSYPDTPGGGVYPGPGYRNAEPDYSIYRPTPCPPPNPPSSPPPADSGLIQRILGWLGKVAWE